MDANATLLVGVTNHEGRPVEYSVVATLQQYAVRTNSTGAEVKALVGSLPITQFNITLRDQDKWERELAFSIPRAGLYKVELELWLLGSTAPYRELHLWVTAY